MAITDAAGLVLSVSIASASLHEIRLVEQVLEERFIEPMPQRMIGHRAYDSDALVEKLRQQGVELIDPHRKNIVKKRRRMAEGCGATRRDGKWSASLPGSSTTEEH